MADSAAHTGAMDINEVFRRGGAEYMVFGREGIGGPQLAEVERMLGDERDTLASERAWLGTRGEQLARSEATLENALTALAESAS